MAPRKYYSSDIKNKIVECFKNGNKPIDISRNFQVPKGTVSKIIKKFKERGTVEVKMKPGRPRKTTKRLDKVIKNTSTKDPRKSSKDIKEEILEQHGVLLSDRTVRRRLNDAGLFGRVAVKKPLISKKNKMGRLLFAREHLKWS